MPKILGMGTSVPPNALTQEEIRDAALTHFRNGLNDARRLIPVFNNVQVNRRHLCVPLSWFDDEHTFSETNQEYIRWAERLSAEAIEEALDRAGLGAEEIDHLIFVSTSGMSTPSIDARLINRMGFRSDVKRTPIFGLGCAGGAAGLSRAHDLARCQPGQKVLLAAVEISSLTFQFRDFSKSNLVASSLFSDGAAAVVVQSNESSSGPTILATQSTLWKGTLDVMGWDFSETGLAVIFSRQIPNIIREHILGNVESFMAKNGLSVGDIGYYIVHPGGAKVLSSFRETLGLKAEELEHSRYVLENFGNMSSPTLLFILDRFCRNTRPEPKEYGLCVAFGPGFSSELLLLGW